MTSIHEAQQQYRRPADKTFKGPLIPAAVTAFEEALSRGAVRVSTADVLVLLRALNDERAEMLTAIGAAVQGCVMCDGKGVCEFPCDACQNTSDPLYLDEHSGPCPVSKPCDNCGGLRAVISEAESGK